MKIKIVMLLVCICCLPKSDTIAQVTNFLEPEKLSPFIKFKFVIDYVITNEIIKCKIPDKSTVSSFSLRFKFSERYSLLEFEESISTPTEYQGKFKIAINAVLDSLRKTGIPLTVLKNRNIVLPLSIANISGINNLDKTNVVINDFGNAMNFRSTYIEEVPFWNTPLDCLIITPLTVTFPILKSCYNNEPMKMYRRPGID